MAFDSVFQSMFSQFNLGLLDLTRLPVDKAREEFRRLCKFGDPGSSAIGKVEDKKIPSAFGPIGLRIYTPVAAGGAALPALVFFHGGGFVLGDLDSYDGLCRTLANESGARVISVDYRLAPENKFPAAIEDSFAALQYIEANAPDLGVDPNRIAVAGDSAGGNLAAMCCILARENGGPEILFQLLMYPVTQVHDAEGHVAIHPAVQWIYSHYVQHGTDLNDARLSPLAAKDLSGLPPAYIVTAGFDPLRDEGRAYAERLKDAGVKVTHIDYPSMVHGFFSMQGIIPLASEAVFAAARNVKAALA